MTSPEIWHGEAFRRGLETVLRTQRLDLEPIGERHADELWAPLADPLLYTHVPQDPPLSLAALRERFALLSQRRSPQGDQLWLNWVLRERSDGQCRGRVQATVTTDALAWIAYEVFPPSWGRGLASEGCRRMMEWLIDELGVRELVAEVDSLNAASLRLLERLGFERASWRAAADHFKGRVSDEWTLRLPATALVRADAGSPPRGAALGAP
ncbi:MAG TPA: GNAT family N-acetyltransferase [Burkholderiaceae bacterium]|nr:GNAT family N-acetyltransferase [Burkholderiaceae bacterium]